MLRTHILTALACVALSTTAAFACTEEEFQVKQREMLTAMQTLMAVDPSKAQALVVQAQPGLEAAAESDDTAAVCEIMDRMIVEATG